MEYEKLEDIPLHVFSNKECTKTPSPDLRKYLRFMLDNHPNDLDYLWRYTQQYKHHGGCYYLTFSNWLKKLERDLKEQENEK
ncbi:MAG: hypothetical protein QXI16_02145 [Sulfolobaceae archaeon]